MSSYASAKTPSTLRGGEDAATWLYIQWHHGTDSRQDSLPDGGWEIERKKYPGLYLSLRTGAVLHGNGTMDAWITESMTFCVIDSRLTWHKDDPNQPRGLTSALPAYQPGAWSRLRVLVWSGELDRLAVLTMRGAASQDFIAGMKAYKAGPLALARLENPDLPVCAFWLTVGPGERTKRGQSSAASWITPPMFHLPPADDEPAIREWLEQNFIGQDLLDRIASLDGMIRQFRTVQPASQPAEHAERPDQVPEQDLPTRPAPTGARCSHGHIYNADKYGDACPTCATIEEARAEEYARAEHVARKQGKDAVDSFDDLKPASEDPAVQAALAEAERKAERRQPVMPDTQAPTTAQDAVQTRSTTNGVETPVAPPGGPSGQISGPAEQIKALIAELGLEDNAAAQRLAVAAIKAGQPAVYEAAAKSIRAMVKVVVK